MLKLIGALLLAGGAGALGCSAAAQLSRRVAVLRALLGALEGMEREIAFRLTPMPELLERAAAESPPPVRTLFARCRTLLDELGERSMAELWREALEQVPLGLDGPGRLALEELGAVYLAVACLAEARELREAGVLTPILLLCYTPTDCAE